MRRLMTLFRKPLSLAVMLAVLVASFAVTPGAAATQTGGGDTVQTRVLNVEGDTGTLNLYYDDRFDFAGYTVAYDTANDTATSTKVGTTTPDDAVLTLYSGTKYIATACGTTTVTLNGTITVSVTVATAPINLIMIIGHSMGQGSEGSGALSVPSEAGQVYSSVSKYYTDPIVSALSDGDNQGIGYASGNRPINIDEMTNIGYGCQGFGSAFAYQWNQLTNEKVWLLNNAVGGSRIEGWVKDNWREHYNHLMQLYNQSVDQYKIAEAIMSDEAIAGHYSLVRMGVIIVSAANGDQGLTPDEYKQYFDTIWTNLKTDLSFSPLKNSDVQTVSFLGIVTSCPEEQTDIGSGNAELYGIGFSPDYPDVYFLSDCMRQVSTDSLVQKWFKEHYTDRGVDHLDYPYRTGTTFNTTLPSSTAALYANTTHLNQYGYNEVGFDIANNLFNTLYTDSLTQSIELLVLNGISGKQLEHTAYSSGSQIVLNANQDYLIVPRADTHSSNKLTVTVTGNAITKSNTNEVQYTAGNKGSTSTIVVKDGKTEIATYVVITQSRRSGTYYYWDFTY